MIYVMVKCYLWGVGSILKYYLDELWLQRVNGTFIYMSGWMALEQLEQQVITHWGYKGGSDENGTKIYL
jgi:hypothetical protein